MFVILYAAENESLKAGYFLQEHFRSVSVIPLASSVLPETDERLGEGDRRNITNRKTDIFQLRYDPLVLPPGFLYRLLLLACLFPHAPFLVQLAAIDAEFRLPSQAQKSSAYRRLNWIGWRLGFGGRGVIGRSRIVRPIELMPAGRTRRLSILDRLAALVAERR